MSDFSLPHNLRLQYSAAQIATAANRIGAEVTHWAKRVWQESGQDLLTVPVLRGGIFFFADLVRKIEHSVQIAPARTWAYESDQTQREEIAFHFDEVPVENRSVLIIDDVCDSGRTMKLLCEQVLRAGANEVKSATLIRRKLAKETFQPDWVGLEYTGEEWFVGYGMDDSERWRNLPDIYVITKG